MGARRYCLSAAALLLAAGMAACGSSNASSSNNSNNSNSNNGQGSGSIKSVNHEVVMLQEKRSFDHYFGHLNDYRTSQGLGADVDERSEMDPHAFG